MQAAVAVLERVDEDEREGDGRGVRDRRHRRARPAHPPVGLGQPRHQTADVAGLGRHEVDALLRPAHALADVVLHGAEARLGVPRVDDAVLQGGQRRLIEAPGIAAAGAGERGGEPLEPARRRALRLDGERRLRLLQVQVRCRPPQQGRRERRGDPAAPLVEPVPLERGERFRAADDGAERPRAGEVVVDPVPGRAGGGGGVVRAGVECVDVPAGGRVGQVERPAGQQLVEEPRPPGVAAGRPGTHHRRDVVRLHGPEERGEDAEVDAVVLEGEGQVAGERRAGVVPRRVEVADDAPAEAALGRRPPRPAGGDLRLVPRRADAQAVLAGEPQVAGRLARRVAALRNRHAARISVTTAAAPRKTITRSARRQSPRP